MLSTLLKGGTPADLKRSDGKMAVDLARAQRSGRMLKCLQDFGVATAAPAAEVALDNGSLTPWPTPMDSEVDAAAALATAEAAQTKKHGEPEPPIDKAFTRPSQSSRVVMARGTDGKPLDLLMTKVDLKRGPCPQNVFYRMQVIHELNQDNFFLFTQWGMIGQRGQFQTTPFESLAKATAEFLKIFKSKAGNDWNDRSNFEQKHLKYLLHELKYPTVGVKDVLNMAKWKRLPAKLTPVPLRRLLNVGSGQQLLANALQETQVEQPLGALKMQPLAAARALLDRIKVVLQQRMEWQLKSEPNGDELQTIMDELASASARLFELIPQQNFSHSRVQPIADMRTWKLWRHKLEITDDITCAARLLLGAQAKISTMSPVDYLYSAMGIRAEPLAADSEELHLLERYINRSAPGECKLFSGEGALPLKEKEEPKTPAEVEAQLPRWQALQDAVCYTDARCDVKQHHAGVAAVAGGTFKEYASQGGAICVRQPTQSRPALWVQTIVDGSPALVKLSDRERASNVAAVYRMDRKGEEQRAGGETATLLFHGSGVANALSILSGGLRVKPPGAAQAGSAFGHGLYFANAYTKSSGYSPGHNGVGLMLLCEVALGKELASQQFGFSQTVIDARVAVAKQKLGLPKDASPADHPALKERIDAITQEAAHMEVDDISGTECDSFHFLSSAAPDPQGSVVHPDGYHVPCGEVVMRNAGQRGPIAGNNATDELIVYDTSKVRLRYVLEIRNQKEIFADVPKPKDDEGDEGDAGAGSPAGPGGPGDGDVHMGDVESDEEDEDKDESGSDDE